MRYSLALLLFGISVATIGAAVVREQSMVPVSETMRIVQATPPSVPPDGNKGKGGKGSMHGMDPVVANELVKKETRGVPFDEPKAKPSEGDKIILDENKGKGSKP